MNEEILFEAMKDIDDRWLREATLFPPKPKVVWWRWIAAAACMVLVSAVTVYALCFTGVKYPTTNAPCEAHQSLACWSTQYYDYTMLANGADAIVVADVVKTSLEEQEYGYSYSMASVKVQEVLKGDVQQGETLTVEDNAMIHTDDNGEMITTTYCGGPLMEKRNRVLLFLSAPDEENGTASRWKITPLSIGKFFYDEDGKYHASCTYSEQAQPDTPNVLEDTTPRTLEEIKRLITG